MGNVRTMLSRGEVDSIILGAAENEAIRLGLTMSPEAKDWLLRRSLRTLDELNERGELDERRSEIERNTSALIQQTFHGVLKSEPRAQITEQHLEICINGFCKKFKDFIPFCT
jgi:hypothetical protein